MANNKRGDWKWIRLACSNSHLQNYFEASVRDVEKTSPKNIAFHCFCFAFLYYPSIC